MNKYVAWVYAIIAPLIIAMLYRVPQDFISIILWVVAFLYVVFICLYLFVKLLRHYVKKDKANLSLPHVIRPIFCLLAYLFANEMVYLSVVSANEKALTLAINMKNHVQKNGQCEKAGKEWYSPRNYPENRVSIKYGNFGTKYYISYVCVPSQKSFSYVVRMNKDSDFRAEYLKNGRLKLTYGHFMSWQVANQFFSTKTRILKNLRK